MNRLSWREWNFANPSKWDWPFPSKLLPGEKFQCQLGSRPDLEEVDGRAFPSPADSQAAGWFIARLPIAIGHLLDTCEDS